MDGVWAQICTIHFTPLIQTIFSYIKNVTKFYPFAQTFSLLEIVHICLELFFFKGDYQARIAGILNGFGSHSCLIKGRVFHNSPGFIQYKGGTCSRSQLIRTHLMKTSHVLLMLQKLEGKQGLS